MLVDPNTGMPIPEGPVAGTLGGAIGMDVAQGYGLDPMNNSALFNVLDNLPSAGHTAGWNALRASNTITRGGFAPGTGINGFIRGGIRNNANPRSWMRFSSPEVMTGGVGYSPINFLSGAADSLTRKGAGRMYAAGTKDWASKAGARYTNLSNNGLIGEEYFTPGLMGRVMAGNKVAGMGLRAGGSARKIAGRTTNALNFMSRTNSGMAQALHGVEGLSQRQVGGLLMGSARGTVTQGIGGYIAGARGMADAGVHNIWNTAGQKAASRFAEKAAGHLALGGIEAGEKIGLKGLVSGLKVAYKSPIGKEVAGKVVTKGSAMLAAKFGAAVGANAIPVVGQVASAIMTAMMVYDIGQMAMGSLAKLPGLAKDTLVSFRGQINKPVMGMGYRDNTVAATSRQRGVMAIQNSQLNARTMLGNEAGGLHAHFG